MATTNKIQDKGANEKKKYVAGLKTTSKLLGKRKEREEERREREREISG